MQKKSFQKKGAIELSMTTIIVIILGITLLSLGLIWVKGTFGDITRLSRGAFEQADGEISNIFKEVDKPVYVSPPSLELQQGEARKVDFTITNFEQTPIKVKAKITPQDQTIKCSFADTQKTESKEYNLQSGKQVKLKIIVEEKDGPLGIKVCNFEVPALQNDNTDSLIITVMQKKSIFG